MLRVIRRRILQAIPVVFGITVITFLLINALPGNAAVVILGTNATSKAQIAALERKLGLDAPLITRYAHWIGGVLTGHLGNSLVSNSPIGPQILQRLPITLELMILAVVLATGLSIVAALLSARKQQGAFDRFNRGFSALGLSVPSFVMGPILVVIFGLTLHVLPASGFVPLSAGIGPNLRTMILPVLTLTISLFAVYTRVLRADMIDQLKVEDYVVTARAQGISERIVLVRYVLRNSLFSLITVIAVNFSVLIGGTVIIENVFSLPGVGSLLIQSIDQRDDTLVAAIVLMMAVFVVVINLLADLVYMTLDPRVHYGSN